MPVWTTHTEGGSWSGGGTQVRDCNATMQNAITNAFNNFINAACLDCFPGLRDRLRQRWNDVEIDCTGSECTGVDGRRSGGKIWICSTDPARIGPVLLHELTHVCDGKELDSEAVEHACFVGNGATLPFGSDWDKFRSETSALDGNVIERVGTYVIWNSDTGEVWARAEEGGGWGGSRIVKGTRCFQASGWTHTYP
jgi:hypothetical protein